MCPLILNKEQRRSPKVPDLLDRKWVEEVAARYRLAQGCLSPAENGARRDWNALGVLINDDLPQILEKFKYLLRSAQR